jgi:hypothetical protein
MKAFPTDDVTLDALEHALGGHLIFDEPADGTELVPRLEGADYSLSQLLDFYSGYDPKLSVPTDHPDTYEYVGGPLYTERDVIRSLIVEVRNCRTPL